MIEERYNRFAIECKDLKDFYNTEICLANDNMDFDRANYLKIEMEEAIQDLDDEYQDDILLIMLGNLDKLSEKN